MLLTVSEVAERLRVSRATVYRIMRRGELRVTWVGSRRRVAMVDLHAYLARNGAPDGAEGGS